MTAQEPSGEDAMPELDVRTEGPDEHGVIRLIVNGEAVAWRQRPEWVQPV